MKEAELIFVPSPVAGHLAATLEFAKRLIDHDDRIQITVVLMNLPLFPRSDAHTRSIAGVNIIALPDLPEEDQPSPKIFETSIVGYMDAVVRKSIPLVKSILSSRVRSSIRIAGFVLDMFCFSLIDLAEELGFPSYVYFTSNAGFLALFQNLPERHRKIGREFEKESSGDGLTIHGFEIPVPTSVLPWALFNRDGGYDDFVKLAQKFGEAKGILVNTFFELESHSMDHFGSLGDDFPPVYPVGPVFDLKAETRPELEDGEPVLKWLDGQPEASVVFLCFGSLGTFGSTQAKEIAKGLEQSGCRFLWSLRTTDGSKPEDHLPEGFLSRVDGRGKMISGWAPQISILAHKSVGGFVSHCGWNSILESIWFGVPIATWPMYAEQQLNAFRIVKELGMAVELTVDYSVDDDFGGEPSVIVMAGEIERAVRCLMESNGENAARKKTMEMSEMARNAVADGGSSFSATERFVMDVLRTGF